MTSIAPCLWYDGQAEQAASFYVSLLPDSRIDHVMRAPGDYPDGQQGDALLVEFTLDGHPFQALNGGPAFHFTEAVSLSVTLDGQAEVDRLWDALIADGGAPGQCGWLKDRWGLSWQIVPKGLVEMFASPDTQAAGRAFAAMMTMTKLDLAKAQAAFEGRGDA